MKFWIRYFREKRFAAALYFATVLLFVIVGSLYHMENLASLCYAFLLSLALCGIAFGIQGMGYVRKSKEVERMQKLLEQGDFFSEKPVLTGEAGESLVKDFEKLLLLFCENHRKEQDTWEEQNAERKDYYMMWTHQIKTPIAAMKLLLENRQDRESFQMREELFKIEQYVEMVIHFQRLESMSQDMVLEMYPLEPMLRQCVKKFAVLFINSGVQIDLCETAAKVLTDEKWFSFCFEQILSNSIKYTERGKIAVQCEEGENCVTLRVADTGIGIRTEDLPRIFERGFTGYNGRMDKKATGIGLYLCKRICGQIGVEVMVESTVGAGTTVTFVIPKRTDG